MALWLRSFRTSVNIWSFSFSRRRKFDFGRTLLRQFKYFCRMFYPFYRLLKFNMTYLRMLRILHPGSSSFRIDNGRLVNWSSFLSGWQPFRLCSSVDPFGDVCVLISLWILVGSTLPGPVFHLGTMPVIDPPPPPPPPSWFRIVLSIHLRICRGPCSVRL